MWGRRVRERARVVGMWRALRAGVWFGWSVLGFLIALDWGEAWVRGGSYLRKRRIHGCWSEERLCHRRSVSRAFCRRL